MIRTKEDLRFYLREDAKANRILGCSYLKYLLRLFAGSESAHVYKYLKTLRHAEYHYNNTGYFHKFLYGFYKIRLHRLGLKYNIRIPINVCGYGLGIYHIVGGVFVNAKSVGNNCILQTGLLIGNSSGVHSGMPIIKDNVKFGPGAKVLGNVVIGNNCFVGANAVVTKDMPDNSLVAGVPAKVIKTLNK